MKIKTLKKGFTVIPTNAEATTLASLFNCTRITDMNKDGWKQDKVEAIDSSVRWQEVCEKLAQAFHDAGGSMHAFPSQISKNVKALD